MYKLKGQRLKQWNLQSNQAVLLPLMRCHWSSCISLDHFQSLSTEQQERVLKMKPGHVTSLLKTLQRLYYRLNVCGPPNLYDEILTPNVMVSGRWLGHKGDALKNGISALSIKAPESSLAPCTMWGPSEKSETWNRPLTQPCWHPDHGLPASRTVRNKLLLFISYLFYGVLLQQPKCTKTGFLLQNKAKSLEWL